MSKNNIIMIGMPGAGKSTVGVVLAKKLGYSFVDADLVIQSREGKLLHELIAERGVEGFWELEEAVGESIEAARTVIATGGSAVYGEKAMAHYQTIGTVVYLSLPLEEIRKRLGDLTERGVTLRAGQDLKELYAERQPLYERYADVTVECEGLSIREIVEKIAQITA